MGKKETKSAASRDDARAAASAPTALVSDAFTNWLDEKKVTLGAVAVGSFKRTGRGVVATRDIDEGEVVVCVPDDAVLTAETSAVREDLEAFLGDDGCESPRLEKELLVIAVMCELCAGEKSSWFPYLSVVYDGARAGHSVLAWTDDEASTLHGTDAWRDAYENDDDGLDLPTMTETHWDNVVRLFFEQNPKLAGGHSMEDLQELHFAATAMVAGYSFTLGDEEIQGMVPFWDMFNHAPPCDAHVRLNHDEKKGLQMITTRKVKKGEEVFNTYGPLRNAELLRRYGFVVARNPHGGTTVGLADVIEAALYVNPELVDELPLRLAWLESRGLADETLETRYFVHQTGRPSSELLIAARVLILNPEEMTTLLQTDFDDEEQLMILEGNDEQRANQSYSVGAAMQVLAEYAQMRYAESTKESRLLYQMYYGVSPSAPELDGAYRAWAAAVVRMDEQRALKKLARWTYHPSRSEDALLHAWPFPIPDDDDSMDVACAACDDED
jgi:SET domain-containing protein 6